MEEKDTSLVRFREKDYDDFLVEYAAYPVFDELSMSEEQVKISNSIKSIEAQQELIDSRIEELNQEIDRLTNHADGADYMIAVGAGVLSALIDSFFVGEFDFTKAKAESNRQVNDFIMKFAKLKGYKEDRLSGAIKFLEEKFPVAQDNIWKGADIGVGTKNHHYADLAHHPTLLGLVASIIVQYFRVGIFANKDGEWHLLVIDTDPKKLLKIWLPVIISGLLLWLVNVAESEYKDKIDEQIPKPIQKLIKMLAAAPMVISILKTAGNWAGHLVSDMGGSKNTAGGGMGIPGLFGSLLHEISAIPLLKETGLPKIANDLYTKNKMDLRSELAVVNELGRQSIPVIIGEVLVRTFYFVRHLILEHKRCGNLKDINWEKVVPFNNRTIARMMTIESGTFTALDLVDAAVRAGVKNGPPNNPLFWKDFILHVNFVGIGRFTVAVGSDISMGANREKAVKERLDLTNKRLALQNAKVYYYQENMWIEAIDSAYALISLSNSAINVCNYINERYWSLVEDCRRFGETLNEADPQFLSELKETLN